MVCIIACEALNKLSFIPSKSNNILQSSPTDFTLKQPVFSTEAEQDAVSSQHIPGSAGYIRAPPRSNYLISMLLILLFSLDVTSLLFLPVPDQNFAHVSNKIITLITVTVEKNNNKVTNRFHHLQAQENKMEWFSREEKLIHFGAPSTSLNAKNTIAQITDPFTKSGIKLNISTEMPSLPKHILSRLTQQIKHKFTYPTVLSIQQLLHTAGI